METQDDIVRRLAVLEALVLALQAENAALKVENAALKADNARLKRLLEQDSSTSHKPPSTDPPSKTPPQKKPTKKRGPKHGHSAFQRLGTPADHVLLHRPDRCDCGCALADALPELGRARLQHIELVDKPFITTDHLLIRLRCPACKRVVRAKPPTGVSRSPYGPRARALVTALTGLAQASKRPAQLLLASLGLKMSLGMLSKLEGQTAALLAAPVEQAKEALHEQAWLGCDETVLKQAGARKYLWVAVGALLAVFGFGGRSRQDKQRVLRSDFAGVVLTDRYNVYEEHAADRRQACWAHLMREMKAREKEEGADSVWAGLLWRQAQTMFLARSMVERGEAASDWSFGSELFRGLVCGLLEQARQAAPQVKLWKWMQGHQASLFVFEDAPGVEPTNNVSERALRVAAAWRKRSQGVQSERGGEFVAGMMSVRESLSKQQRNPFTFLIDLHRANALGLPQPSLLPSP